jgi:hypothetical protein
MGARARKTDKATSLETPVVGPARPRPQPASAGDAAAPSPALQLQQALHAEVAAPEVKKWPPAATLGFIVVTCGAFWGLVALGLAAALK